MIFYISAIIVAALLQIATIYFLRANFLGSFLYAIPLILAYQFLFLWSYAKAPSFIIIWIITTGLTNALALILGYFIYHEQLSFFNWAGVVLVLCGIVLLNLK